MPKSETTYLFHQQGKWLIYDKNDHSFSHLEEDEEEKIICQSNI